MKKFVTSLLLGLLLVANQAYAKEKTLVVATNPTWPPMQLIDLNKKITGYEIDLIQAIAAKAGYQVQLKPTEWDGIFATLESKNADLIVSCVTVTDERKKRYLFSDPTYEVVQALVVPKDSMVSKHADMKGLRVGVQIGTTAIVALESIDEDFVVSTYDDVGLALEDLVIGRIDAVMCDDPVARYYSARKDGFKDKMKIAFLMEEKEDIAMVALKSNTELMDELMVAYKAITDDGTKRKIHEEWFGAE